MSGISQRELEAYLLKAANMLRGHMGAADYKSYIFPILFWKRICDIWDEEYAVAKDMFGISFPENHRITVPEKAHWEYVRKQATNVGSAILEALRLIESGNPKLLEGIFGDARWTNKDKLSDSKLKDLIEHFSSLKLNISNLPEDELGNGYEYLIKKFADDSGHTAAEFYTNRTVVHLMIDLLKPEPGESIYDPTCGSGGMLVSSLAYIKKLGLEHRNIKLYGQEINLLTSSIARINLFLHGVEDFQISRGDTLSNPKFIESGSVKKFDVILANPPYSIKSWDRSKWQSDKWGRNKYGTPPQGCADYAFIQHILHSMKETTGRSAVLLPTGVLFREKERDFRRRILAADLIECVILIAPDLFYNSNMESCIIVYRKGKEKERRNKIQFIDARELYYRKGSQNFLSLKQIREITNLYEEFSSSENLSEIVSVSEIEKNDFNLNVEYYVGNIPNLNLYKGNDSLDENVAEFLDSSSEFIEMEFSIIDLPKFLEGI